MLTISAIQTTILSHRKGQLESFPSQDLTLNAAHPINNIHSLKNSQVKSRPLNLNNNLLWITVNPSPKLPLSGLVSGRDMSRISRKFRLAFTGM
jgi:hypothetical protein